MDIIKTQENHSVQVSFLF